MPRPRRHQGRPGTQVIPEDWEADHAVVADKTRTATCTFTAPGGTLAFDDDLNLLPGSGPAPLYSGPCRVQILTGRDAVAITGDQKQSSTVYRVTVARDAAALVIGAAGAIVHAGDASLTGPLIVERIDRGSLRFERVIYCVEDQTRPSTS